LIDGKKIMMDHDSPRTQSIVLSRLRPTQFTVGMLEVKFKRKRLRMLEKRPGELVDYILELPIRVVIGPQEKVYVIDHHHLALALLKEGFQTAPMVIEADFSQLDLPAFWTKMQAVQWVHLVSGKGKPKTVDSLPKCLEDMKDDPYRSLAGFVRVAGGYAKTPAPFAEFQWAEFFRPRVEKKDLRTRFEKTVNKCVQLAASAEAAGLPGYLGHPESNAATQ
jgi:hypothetical protein